MYISYYKNTCYIILLLKVSLKYLKYISKRKNNLLLKRFNLTNDSW